MAESVAKVELSVDIVRKYIAPKATEQEIYFFLQLCKAQQLNPFLREVYLIKYKDGEPASIVTGKDLFLKRATRNTNYQGFKAGVVVANARNEVTYREGGMAFYGEKIIGGWSEVLRCDRVIPIRSEVSFDEYVGLKPVYANGKPTGEMEPNRQWAAKPGTMIRKVALVQALREAFPDELEGLYSPEEFPHIELSSLPEYSLDRPQSGYIAPPAEKAPEPKEEPKETVKDKLHDELALYSQFEDGTVDIDMYQAVLKEVSTFTGKNKKGEAQEYFITDIFADNVSEKWAGTALRALRERTKKSDSSAI